MSTLLDTSAAIAVAERLPETLQRLNALRDVRLSIITRIELEAGLAGGNGDEVEARSQRLDLLLLQFPVLPFGDREAAAYRLIVQTAGFSRRKIIDRMIAAQALVQGAALVTLNAADFRDVPGLTVLDWS